jgi:hypothetical protein
MCVVCVSVIFLNSYARARINSIRFIALRKFLSEVANYMAELQVMHGLVSEAAHKLTEAASEAMGNLKKNGTPCICNRRSHIACI